MVGRMGGGLHFLVEIELEMAKMPAFTNLKLQLEGKSYGRLASIKKEAY